MTAAQRPLKVLEVFQPPEGGVPEHVWRLTRGLGARGHEVLVAGPADAALRPRFTQDGAAYHPIPVAGRVPAPASDARTLRALDRLLEDGVDVVHAHGQKAGLLARPAARRAGVPAVYSPHSFVYRTQLRRDRRGGRARRALMLRAERALGRRSAAIVACAQDERRAAVEDRIAPPERVQAILYGVEPQGDAPPDPRLAEFRGPGPLLGFVAGLREQKGLPTLLDALELLARDGAAVRFAIVGNGPLREEVERRIADGPLAATTLLAPFAGRVEPYLASLDAFVLPSLWEGMPIAVLEAMAMGVPVVASAVDGTPEAISHGRTGLLVPPRDPPALAGALRRLASDASERARMGAAAQADARARFTVPRMVDEIEALYLRVAGGAA